MAEELDAIRAKVQRAKEHFAWLVQAHAQFMSLNPYGVILDENTETRQRIWRARISSPAPAYWSLVAGDIVHNLRAALDFLAFRLWEANGRKGTTEDGIYFRVFPNKPGGGPPAAAEVIAARERVEKELGAIAEAVWDRLQPYRAGDAYEAHPLYALHQLDIWDKHRLLNLATYALESQQGHIGDGRGGKHVYIEHFTSPSRDVIRGPLADGAELQKLILGAGTDVEVEFNFTLHITFEVSGPGRGKPLLVTLDELIRFVDEAITKFALLFD